MVCGCSTNMLRIILRMAGIDDPAATEERKVAKVSRCVLIFII